MTPHKLSFVLPEKVRPAAESGENSEMAEALSLHYGGPVADLLASTMLKPLGDLITRPCKKVRGRLVAIGWEIAQPGSSKSPVCQRLMESIELLHAGSLAVDDVQDGSQMRRGSPALHLKYGLPVALNIGNFLYFRPLEIIEKLGLPAEQELALYRLYHRTLLRAHYGQALDVGLIMSDVPQDRVYDACLATLELKSGALMALALLMGAVAAGAGPQLTAALDELGHGFGIGLQMFDDLGNLKGTVEPAKRWEDLILRRPTWVWACAAKYCDPDSYARFALAVRQLPRQRSFLEKWFEQNDFMNRCKLDAQAHFNACFDRAESTLKRLALEGAGEPFGRLRHLAQEISKAYG